MKPINLSKLLTKYKNGWIALTPDNHKFLTSGETLKQVIARANKRGVTNPTVFKAVPTKHFAVG